jgi:hypothetical protein
MLAPDLQPQETGVTYEKRCRVAYHGMGMGEARGATALTPGTAVAPEDLDLAERARGEGLVETARP